MSFKSIERFVGLTGQAYRHDLGLKVAVYPKLSWRSPTVIQLVKKGKGQMHEGAV